MQEEKLNEILVKNYRLHKAGRPGKKPRRNDAYKKVVIKKWKKKFEEVIADLIMSIENEDFSQLSLKDKLQLIPGLAKYFIPEMKAVDVKENVIKKIEVSFSEDYTAQATPIDIKHEEIKLIEDEETPLLENTNEDSEEIE